MVSWDTDKQNCIRMLLVGDVCTTEEKNMLLQPLPTKHQVFALSEGELGETDLVQHKIEMKEANPFSTSHCRLST